MYDSSSVYLYLTFLSTKLINSREIQEVFKGKNIDEEFFQYKSGVGHYHSGAKGQAGMIDYTFLLPGKNDICVNIQGNNFYIIRIKSLMIN